MTVPYGSTMRSTSRRADRTDNDLSMRVVDAVVLTSSEWLALAVTFERMLQRDPTLAGVLDPATRDDLRDVNDAALGERRRRLENDWQATLVPIRVAAERLDVSPQSEPSEAGWSTRIPARRPRRDTQPSPVLPVITGLLGLVEPVEDGALLFVDDDQRTPALNDGRTAAALLDPAGTERSLDFGRHDTWLSLGEATTRPRRRSGLLRSARVRVRPVSREFATRPAGVVVLMVSRGPVGGQRFEPEETMMINTRMRAKVACAAALIGASMLVASAATAEPVDHFRQARSSLMMDCAANDGNFRTSSRGYGCEVAFDDGAWTSIWCKKDGSCTMVTTPPTPPT